MKNAKKAFERDLKKGKEHEQLILNFIKEKYPLAVAVEGYFKGFDIWVPEVDTGVEVKSDEKSKFTGNVVIEIEFGGKPSALSTTTAKYWVIWDGIEYSWFLVDDIWKCIEERELSPVSFTGKGDDVGKKAYLIMKSVLWKYRSSITI